MADGANTKQCNTPQLLFKLALPQAREKGTEVEGNKALMSAAERALVTRRYGPMSPGKY
jgi:hypothetical protein